MTQHLFIRTDATAQMGTGHVMRGIALAEAWTDAGGEVTFVSHCESPNLRARIQGDGYPLLEVSHPHPHPHDLEFTRGVIRARPDSVLALDGYHFRAPYQKALRETCIRLAVVDDHGHCSHYHGDFLINQNLHAERIAYPCGEETRFLLGPRYAMLRREFAQRPDTIRTIPDTARRMLITLGGSDPANEALKVIRAVKQLDVQGLEAVVVAGPANPHIDQLEAAVAGKGPAVTLVRYAMRMRDLLEWADVAVSAGGTTCWEMACMGVPNVILVLADNQEAVARSLHRAGISWDLGRANHLSGEQLAKHLRTILKDARARREMSLRGHSLVDGLGAARVAAALRGDDNESEH
jgi:UDP-2,4-diacetamido-2,4,6-trideoxy-beta-L-altropyranose hydrolase